MTEAIETRVARGAALLDERWPGWWREIDTDRLRMTSDCDCVLGQVFGSYWEAADLVGFGYEDACDHGFNARDQCETGTLKEPWIAAIRRRQEPDHADALPVGRGDRRPRDDGPHPVRPPGLGRADRWRRPWPGGNRVRVLGVNTVTETCVFHKDGTVTMRRDGHLVGSRRGWSVKAVDGLRPGDTVPGAWVQLERHGERTVVRIYENQVGPAQWCFGSAKGKRDVAMFVRWLTKKGTAP